MSVRNLLPIALLLATGLVGCTGSPLQTEGSVTVTQTTSTTTTTAMPLLVPGVIAHGARPERVSPRRRCIFLFRDDPVGRRAAVYGVVEFRRWRSRARDWSRHTPYDAPGNFTADGDGHRQQGHFGARPRSRCRFGSVTGRWNVDLPGYRPQARRHRHRPEPDRGDGDDQRDSPTDLPPEPAASPIRGRCRSA